MSSLHFDHVTVRYGASTVLDEVSLTVPDGEIVGLVGESGSGKSTLAKAAVGLAPVHGGQILLDGAPIRLRGRYRPVSMVFQDPYSSLDPRMTVGESIAEALGGTGVGGTGVGGTGVGGTGVGGRRADRLSRAGRRAEIGRLLELVHVDAGRASQLPGQLSGGQRQRVALARALAGRPQLVIADEITSALDVSVQGAVLNLVREMQRELGLSMLFISHNLAVVRYVASQVAVLEGGRIVEHGRTADVLERPRHDYTRQLLAAIPGGHDTQNNAQTKETRA